jgi:hypothetical protein
MLQCKIFITVGAKYPISVMPGLDPGIHAVPEVRTVGYGANGAAWMTGRARSAQRNVNTACGRGPVMTIFRVVKTILRRRNSNLV